MLVGGRRDKYRGQMQVGTSLHEFCGILKRFDNSTLCPAPCRSGGKPIRIYGDISSGQSYSKKITSKKDGGSNSLNTSMTLLLHRSKKLLHTRGGCVNIWHVIRIDIAIVGTADVVVTAIVGIADVVVTALSWRGWFPSL